MVGLYLLLLLGVSNAIDYDPRIAVLTDANFDESIKKSPHMIKFFAPWCGMCKKLAPFWNQIPDEIGSANVIPAVVDATSQTKLSNKYDISAYPTIKLIGTGKLGNELAIDFPLKFLKGGGEHKQLAAWAVGKGADIDKAHATMIKLQEHEQAEKKRIEDEQEAESMDENRIVKRITTKNFEKLRKDITDVPGNILLVKFYVPTCKTCQKLAPRFNAVAEHMKETKNVFLAEVDCTVHKKVCDEEGVPHHPLLIKYTNDNMKGEWPGEPYEKVTTVKEMTKEVGGDPKTLPKDVLQLDEEIDAEVAQSEKKSKDEL